MIAAFHAFEVRLANVLPGWKTHIFAVLGIVLGVFDKLDPTILGPVLPPSWQAWAPLVCLVGAYYSHRLSRFHD